MGEREASGVVVNRCVDCKHWGGGTAKDQAAHNCCDIALLDLDTDRVRLTLHGEGADRTSAALLTSPDFGCVLWEAK